MKILVLIPLSLLICHSFACSKFYTIVPNDICVDIAQKNGISLDQLLDANPGINCDLLQEGAQICLDKSNSTSPSNPELAINCNLEYTILDGDICIDIAEVNGISVDQLSALNQGLNCNNLEIGKVICVSGDLSQSTNSVPSGTCSSQYIVIAGDICDKITQNNELSLDQLLNFNPGLDCNFLRVGQVLCLNAPFGETIDGVASNGCSNPYTIATDDTCYDIAQKNGFSLSQLNLFNPGLDCTTLEVGKQICLAANSGATTGASTEPIDQPNSNSGSTSTNKTYTIIEGDICYDIAIINGLSLDELIALNTNLDCNNLEVGQQINIGQGVDINSDTSNQLSGTTPSEDISISYEQFSAAVTGNGFPAPTQDQYNAFISYYASAGGITSQRELAMFLAEILLESGGLQFKSEIRCQQDSCPNDYRVPGDDPTKFYYGRGYIQLTWSYNYRSASLDLFGDARLVLDPDQVATDENMSWETAFWFWKTNVHDDPGVQNGQLGSATNRINGGLECNPCRGSCTKRFTYYQEVLSAWGMNDTPSNAGC